MTRIIAGSWAGRRLAVPSSGARPTTDRVREAVFSSLDHRIGGWAGRRVVDLFAGSGALGLEALSRGAEQATLVERDRAALAVIRANAASLGAGSSAVIVAADATRWRPPPGTQFDLVLVDPPYAVASGTVAELLRELGNGGALSADALIVVERSAREDASPWPDAWPPGQRRRYGETAVWYGGAHSAQADLEGS